MTARKKGRRTRKLICHGTSCGEPVARGDAVTCEICKKPFCRTCLSNDRLVTVCDDCLISLVAIKMQEIPPEIKLSPRGLIADAKEKLERIGKLKGLVSITRDALRSEINNVRDLCESLDSGTEDIEIGIRTLTSGLDSLSELI